MPPREIDAALDIALHEKQQDAFFSDATEILYGGAAGGGKSHLMRMAAIMWCSEIPGLQVYLFRRIRDDLVKNHVEGPSGFREFLAGWVECGFVKIVEEWQPVSRSYAHRSASAFAGLAAVDGGMQLWQFAQTVLEGSTGAKESLEQLQTALSEVL